MRREFFIFATKRTETDEQGERRSRRTPQTPFSLRKHVSSEKYSTVKKIKNVQSVFFDSRTALRYISPLSPLRRSRAVAQSRGRALERAPLANALAFLSFTRSAWFEDATRLEFP